MSIYDNIERMEKERQRLIDDQGKDHSYEEQRGLDVYTVHSRSDNRREIADLDRRIAAAKKAAERERAAREHEARIDRFEREQREREERRNSGKYTYTVAGEKRTTDNPALAARYDAQHRYFGMSKLKQAWYRLNGQYGKFNELWKRAGNDKGHAMEDAEKLDKLFGGKSGRR